MEMTDGTAKLGSCSLPGDVMVDILQCLPVKSLLRFRSVSKSWYIFLTSRDFIQMHYRHPHHEKLLRVSDKGPRRIPTISYFSLDLDHVPSHDDDQIEVYTGNDTDNISAVTIDLPFPCNPDDEARVVGSVNGILCVHFNRSSTMILWNPATKRYRFLKNPDSVDSVSFYWDSFFPYIMIGYVPETDDYKVIKVPSVRKETGQAWVWVYTLSSDSWQEIGPVRHGLLPKGGSSVTLNGCLYWLSPYNGLDVLTSFDLFNQVFNQIELPNPDIPTRTVRKLVVLKGRVSLIMYSGNDVDVNHYEVWVMTAPESWTKRLDFPSFSKLAQPVGSWKDSELLFGYRNELSHELLSYNPFTKRTQSFQRRSSSGGFKVINYVESLESVESS